MTRRGRPRNSTRSGPPLHPRSCQCSGTGFVPCEPFVGVSGRVYEKVSTRCPGKGPGPVVSGRDLKRISAGDRDE